MKVIRVVGHSGAGKTTLVERLVPVLADRGRVATVKSIHHDVEFDDPGTDTHRHRVAGAERVVGVTPSRTFSVESRGKGDAPSEADALARLLSDLHADGYDYVVVEGFSAASLPALVLDDRDAGGEDAVVARVADSASEDVDALASQVDRLDPWTGSP